MSFTMSNSSVPLSPFLSLNENHRLRSHVLVRSVTGDDSAVIPPESVRINGEKKNVKVHNVKKELEPLWDDGYGTQTMKDCIRLTMDFSVSAQGPPRWFCPVACGKPLDNSPLLLFLPGIDGTGGGLVVHEKSLGKVFHVQCLHIPVYDRTPLEGLIKIVEETVMAEHTASPSKPIYLLGESFGGALALAVAARNPTVDLVLIIANPATSYERSQLHPIDGLLKPLPERYYYELKPFILSRFLGNYVNVKNVEIDGPSFSPSLLQVFGSIAEDVSLLYQVGKLFPNEAFEWRLKLAESVAAYANSRLRLITAQVLILASGKDQLLPSKNEAKRLSRILKHCNIRVFEENSHTILLEGGVNMLSAIKTTQLYRRSLKHDVVNDFLPPSITELKKTPMDNWWYRLSTGATMFSTMDDGTIVRGITGIPDEGPVLLVGNHMLSGFESFHFFLEFLREKGVMLHTLADPENTMTSHTDLLKLFGTIPHSKRNLSALLLKKSYTLLNSGGTWEASNRKEEACKFWPDEHFVRMAVKFGATIIPFGVVGEDDISEPIADYDKMKKLPFLERIVNESNRGITNMRKGMMVGETIKQQLRFPIIFPKLPGRLYYMFGKPIQTKGKEHMLNEKDYLQELYLEIKGDVENNMAYLLTKREEDPYRGLVKRLVWAMTNGSLDQIPSFDP